MLNSMPSLTTLSETRLHIVMKRKEEKETSKPMVDVAPKLLNVFPNPAKDHITLRFNPHVTTREATLQIWDASGRLVFHDKRMIDAGANELILEQLSLPNGTYTIQLYREPFLTAAKFVIYK